MNVNTAGNIAQTMSTVTQNQNTQNTQATQETAPAAAPTATEEAAVYTPSAPVTGNNAPTQFQPDTARVQEMWRSHNQQVESFRRMVETLMEQQAQRQFGMGNPFWRRDEIGMGNPEWDDLQFVMNNIEVTDEMRAEANAMLGEGGYFSIEETAGRILEFAVALSGGDPDRIDDLSDAVERAFAQVERMFGEMPQISHDTLAAVREGFDQWREGGAGAIALLNR